MVAWIGEHWDTAGLLSAALALLAALWRMIVKKSSRSSGGVFRGLTRFLSAELRASLSEAKAAAWEEDSRRKDERIGRILAELDECRAASCGDGSTDSAGGR